MKLLDHGDSLMAVLGFADHFEVTLTFQDISELLAHGPVIVCQQDGDSFHDTLTLQTVVRKERRPSCAGSTKASIGDFPRRLVGGSGGSDSARGPVRWSWWLPVNLARNSGKHSG